MSQREEINRALDDLRKSEMKSIVKLAIKEWLDEQAAKFGHWSFRFLLALMLGVLLYGALVTAGWTPPPVPALIRSGENSR